MFSGVFRSALLSTRSDLTVKSALQHGWLYSCCWPEAAVPAGGSSVITVRSKHSNTQIKRLFKFNQARIRINKKKGIAPRYEELPQQQFKKVHSFKYLPNTWTEPPAERPDYPFAVARTKNKPFDAVGFLPVYTKYRNDNTKVITRIKKVTGDRDAFISELRAVVGLPKPLNPNNDKIKIKTGGTIEVHTNCSGRVKRWLAGLGF